MEKICKRAKTSPLCNDRPMYYMIKSKADKENVPIWILLGIMSKESWFGTLWHHTNVENCRANTFNWHWSKADRRADRAYRDQYIWPWCRLYKYESIEHWIQSLVYTIGRWYKACLSRKTSRDMVVCISYKYVWQPNVSEDTRVNHVLSYQ
jgi:hypothetical protein